MDAKLTDLVRRWSVEYDGADANERTIATLEGAAVISSRPSKSTRPRNPSATASTAVAAIHGDAQRDTHGRVHPRRGSAACSTATPRLSTWKTPSRPLLVTPPWRSDQASAAMTAAS